MKVNIKLDLFHSKYSKHFFKEHQLGVDPSGRLIAYPAKQSADGIQLNTNQKRIIQAFQSQIQEKASHKHGKKELQLALDNFERFRDSLHNPSPPKIKSAAPKIPTLQSNL
jgi:hypothetical protein